MRRVGSGVPLPTGEGSGEGCAPSQKILGIFHMKRRVLCKFRCILTEMLVQHNGSPDSQICMVGL